MSLPCRITVVLLATALATSVRAAAEKNVTCEERCARIHERSLDRIAFSAAGADKLIDRPRADPARMREVCWKQYDYFYCMKGCPKTKEHEAKARHVKARCKQAIRDLEPGLSCLYKYRSFLEIRCSSFMNEAVRRKIKDPVEYLPDRETCRYLHLNALCLENAASAYCPQATPFFGRLHLRDYFLNFILPEDDLLFDDQDLDACQMKDFVKEALEGISVSPRLPAASEEEGAVENATVPLSSSTADYAYDDDDDDSEEEEGAVDDGPSSSMTSSASPPLSTSTPPVVRTLSPSTTRGQHPLVHSSTAGNFVYTTTKKQPASSLIGTPPDAIHVTKEQVLRTSTMRNGYYTGPGKRITITPKPIDKSERGSTQAPPPTSTRRRLFDSDEDFSQTPPNFLWGSFRQENLKLARNYSESFPAGAQFVTPVTIDSSTLFGDDEDSREDAEDYGRPAVDFDRSGNSGEPVTVTGRPLVKHATTIVSLVDDKGKRRQQQNEEDRFSIVYEHAVDTQLQPTVDTSTPIWLGSAEKGDEEEDEVTTRGVVLPTDADDDAAADADDDDDDDDDDLDDENAIDPSGDDEEEMQHGSREGLDALLHKMEQRKAAERNFESALGRETAEEVTEDSNEIIQAGVVVGPAGAAAAAADEKLNLQPTPPPGSSLEPFTPLINGGRVAVKSIKTSRMVGEDSAQDWTEDPNQDPNHVNVEGEGGAEVDDFDEDDRDFHVSYREKSAADEEEMEARRRINFILAYTALFIVLLLLVVCCTLFFLLRNRRNADLDQPYKHDSL